MDILHGARLVRCLLTDTCYKLEESKVESESKEHEHGLLVDMPVLIQSHVGTFPCQCTHEQARTPVATIRPRSCILHMALFINNLQ